MYALPPDLVTDCIRAYFIGQQITGPGHFLYKTADTPARLVTQAPAGRSRISPTLTDVTIRDTVTRPLNDVTMQDANGQGRLARNLLSWIANRVSGNRNGTGNAEPQDAAQRRSASDTPGGNGNGDGGRGRRDGGGSGDQRPPGPSDQSGDGQPRSNRLKYLLWPLIGLGAVGGGWWLSQQPWFQQDWLPSQVSDLSWGNIPTGQDLQRLYQLQISKSDALPWLVGGIAGLVRYLMHDENDESDPIWSALKVALLAGLGTEAIRQYSTLSSIGVSQPLPKMFQHLLAQIGLATEPNWLKDLNMAKYRDARAQLYAKPPKGDQASQDSQSSNGAASSTTQGPAARSGSNPFASLGDLQLSPP